jgi:hypothetical protein
MPGSHGVVGYAASESWPEVLLGHSERQHHRREGTDHSYNAEYLSCVLLVQRQAVAPRSGC